MRSLTALIVAGVLPAGAAVQAEEQSTPVRSSTAGAVWSASPGAFRKFVQTGVVANRSLVQLIA
jgi:hypothetical protein